MFTEACAVWESIRSVQRLILTLTQLGGTHAAQRDFNSAFLTLQRAVAIARDFDESAVASRVCMNSSDNGNTDEDSTCSTSFDCGDVANCQSACDPSPIELESCRAALAAALAGVGHVLMMTHDYEAALDSLRECLGLRQRLANGGRDRDDRQRHRAIHRARTSVLARGVSFEGDTSIDESSEFDAAAAIALSHLMPSAPLMRPFEAEIAPAHRHLLTSALLSMAICHQHLGNHLKALTLYSKCRRMREEIKDALGVAEVLDNVAHLYHSLGDFEQSIVHLEAARVIYMQSGVCDGAFFASSALLRGTRLALQDTDKMIGLLEVIRDRHIRTDNIWATAIASRALGVTLTAAADCDRAVFFLLDAEAKFEALAASAADTRDFEEELIVTRRAISRARA
jgi:tetratricopeptide (TPR) repeat protein